jgi:exodeoxyribonuclease VII small subunit
VSDESPAFEAMTFEQLVEELEATVARMASGNLGIEEVTDLYERAGRLHALAGERLAAISARIEKLTNPPT